ncbi:MAG: FtsX-like permease family protein [Chitinophagales bacterium]
MWLINLAWKNLWRNKTRTAINMAAVFFAVIFSVFASSLQKGIFDNLIKNVVSFYTGYLQIHKNWYWNEQVLDNSLTYDSTLSQKILQIANVSTAAPRLETFALIATDKNTKGCMVVGIDPEKENLVTSLKSKVIKGSYLQKNDNGVLISEGLANRIKANVNDTIFLIGQGYHGATAAGKYKVKGKIRFGSPNLNNQIIFLSLSATAELFSAQQLATSVVLSLKNPGLLHSSVEDIQKRLGTEYEVMSWENIMPDVKQHMETDRNSMRYIQGILYMLVSFGIFGALLMMMVERKYELGMLVAIGMKKNNLCILLTIESVLTVFGGCVLGLITNIPIVYYFNRHALKLGGETARIYEKFGFEAIFPTSTSADNFISQGITVLVIGLILSLYPIIKILRINPATSMKR